MAAAGLAPAQLAVDDALAGFLAWQPRGQDDGARTPACTLLIVVACAVMAHGLLDFYEAADLGWRCGGSGLGRFSRVYEMTLLVFGALLFAQPVLAVFLFVAGSVAHFGEDLRFVLAAPPVVRCGGALLFGGAALTPRNAAGWALLLDLFAAPGAQTADSPAMAQAATALAVGLVSAGLLAVFWLAAAHQWRALALAMAVGVTACVLGPVAALSAHMALVHTPLSVYRVVRRHGWPPLLLWLGATAVASAVVLALLDLHGSSQSPALDSGNSRRIAMRLGVAFGVAVTVPHMVVTTAWQRIVDTRRTPEVPEKVSPMAYTEEELLPVAWWKGVLYATTGEKMEARPTGRVVHL